MVLYPEVFKKAQREIDAVIGRQRLPTLKTLEPPVFGLPGQGGVQAYRTDLWQMTFMMGTIYPKVSSTRYTFYPERYLEDPELPDPHPLSSVSVEVAANIIATMELSPAVDSDGSQPRFCQNSALASSGEPQRIEAQNQTARLALPPEWPGVTTQAAVGSTAVKLMNWGQCGQQRWRKVRLANEENARKSNGGSPDEDDNATLLSLSAPSTKKNKTHACHADDGDIRLDIPVKESTILMYATKNSTM
ncbi:hypothetical protein IMY05_C4839000900 [Salix suchowensis]|nr:hypothetical protein IMY05_C4839000900 [Salix suchowensis]